jgi:hypothetical protein
MLFFYYEFVKIFREFNKDQARDNDEIQSCLRFCERKAGKQFKDEEEEIARKKLQTLSINFKTHWKKANRTEKTFEANFKGWLETAMEFEISQDFKSPSAKPNLKGPGRNEKSFHESSDRTKIRKRDRMIASNVARRLFDEPEAFASVLGIDCELVKNLSLLLTAIRSFHKVNIEEFRRLSTRAMQIFKEKYQNFRPSPKVHFLLIHAVDVIAQIELAPGFYSEEGPESNNRHLRKDRNEHARHDNRKHNMEDVYKRSLARSDPKVAKIGLARRLQMKKQKPMSPELRKLLILEGSQDDETSDN